MYNLFAGHVPVEGDCEIFLSWAPNSQDCDSNSYIVSTYGIEAFACFNATFCETQGLPDNLFRHCTTPDDSIPMPVAA